MPRTECPNCGESAEVASVTKRVDKELETKLGYDCPYCGECDWL